MFLFLLQAQVTSSDALKNAPWILYAGSQSTTDVDFTPNDTFAKTYASESKQSKINVIKIPKSTVGFVSVGKYKLSETVNHMPLVSTAPMKLKRLELLFFFFRMWNLT